VQPIAIALIDAVCAAVAAAAAAENHLLQLL